MNKTLLFILLTSIYLQAQTKDVSLVLPWKHQFEFAGYYVAKELGFYEKAGLNVHIKEYESNTNTTKDIANQKYDFGVGYSFVIFEKITKYPNIILMSAIYQSSPLVLLSLKRDDLKFIQDIKNKKIMMTTNHSVAASIRAMLFSQEIYENMYTTVEETFTNHDLINGNIDLLVAYSSNEPYLLKSKGLQYTIFDPREYGYDFYNGILFTSQEMIENDPQTVSAFHKASLQGWDYAYKNIDKTIEIILKKYNTQSKTYAALKFEAQTLKKLSFKEAVAFGSITPKRLKDTVKTYRLLHLGKMKEKIDYESFIYKNDVNLSNFTCATDEVAPTIRDAFILNTFYSKDFLFFILFLLIASFIYYKTKIYYLGKNIIIDKKRKLVLDTHIHSFIIDTNKNILTVSQALLKLTHYYKDELTQKHYTFLASLDNEIMIKDFWLTLSSGHVYKGNINLVHKNTDILKASVIASPIFKQDKSIKEYFCILTIKS
ncbi:MAG: ABC transporter substrate-binding protein [Sulfurimonas sp.]|nr:ABC transporter substrate-binding protein [Sulfurimonas sp.]MDQ7061136.1 ABC transporter substrate-binding protein [Sulfurimonas sp.]